MMACINVEDPTVDVADIETYRLAFLMQFFVQHKPRFRFPKLRLQDIYQRVIKDSEPTAFCDLVARILRFQGNGDPEICIDRVDQALDRFTVDKRTSYRIQVQRDRNGKSVHQLAPAARAGLLYNLIESIYDEQPDFSFTSGFNGPGANNNNSSSSKNNNSVSNPASVRCPTADSADGDMTTDELMSDGMPQAIPDFADADITIKAGQDAQGFSYYYMDDLRLYRERPHSGISSHWDVAVGPTTSQWQTFINALSRNEKDNDLYYFLNNELFDIVRVSLEGYELEQPNPELATDCLRAKEASELHELRRHKASQAVAKSGSNVKPEPFENSAAGGGKQSLTPVSSSAAGATAGGGGALTAINGPKSASPSFSGGHSGGGSATTPLTPGTARTPTSAPPAIGLVGSVCALNPPQQTNAQASAEGSAPLDAVPPAGVKPSPPSIMSTSSPSPVLSAGGEAKPPGFISISAPCSLDEANPMPPAYATASSSSNTIHSADAVFSGLQKLDYPGMANRYSPRAPAGDSLVWSQRQQVSSTCSSTSGTVVPPPAYSGHHHMGLQVPSSPSQPKPAGLVKPGPLHFPSADSATSAAAAGPTGPGLEHMSGLMSTGDQMTGLQHSAELASKLVGPLASGSDGALLTQEQLENRKSKLAQLEKINSTLSKSKSASTPGATAAFALQQQQHQQQRMQLHQQQQLVDPIQVAYTPPCCQAQTTGPLPYASGQQNLPPMGNFPVRPSTLPLGYRMSGNDPTGQRDWDRVCCPDYQRENMVGDLVCGPPRMPSSSVPCLRGLPESAAMSLGSGHLEYASSTSATVPPLASAYASAPNSTMISSTPVLPEPTPGLYQLAGPQSLPQYTTTQPNCQMPDHADVTASSGPPVVMVPPNNSNLTSPSAYHPHHMMTTANGVLNGSNLPIHQVTVMRPMPHCRPTAAAAVVTDQHHQQQQHHFSGQKRTYYPPGGGAAPLTSGDSQWVQSGGGLSPASGQVDMLTLPGYRFPSSYPANPITSIAPPTATTAASAATPTGSARGSTGGSKASKKRKTAASAASVRNSGTPVSVPSNSKSTAATPTFNQSKLAAPMGASYPPQTGYHHQQQQQQQHVLRRPSHHNPMYSCQPVLPGQQQHLGYHSTDPYLMTTGNGPVYQDMMGGSNGSGGPMPETRRSLTPKGCGGVADPYALAPCTSMRGPAKSYVSGLAGGTILPVSSSAYLMSSEVTNSAAAGQDMPAGSGLRSNNSGSPNTQNLTSTCLANLARLSQMSGPEAPSNHMGSTGSSLPASYVSRSSGGGTAGLPPAMMTGSNNSYSSGPLLSDTRSKHSMATPTLHMAETTEPPTASSAKYLPPASGYPSGPVPLPQQQQQPPPSIQVNNTFFNAQLNVQQMNYQHVSAPGSTGQMQIHFVQQQQQQQQQQAHDARVNPRTAAPTDAPGGGLRSASSDFYSPADVLPASCHRGVTGGSSSAGGSGGYSAMSEPHQLPLKISDTPASSNLLPTSAASLSISGNSCSMNTVATVSASTASNTTTGYGNTSIQIMPRTPHTIQYLPTVNSGSSSDVVGGGNTAATSFHQHQQSSELASNNNNFALRAQQHQQQQQQQQPHPTYPQQAYYTHSQQQQAMPVSTSIYSQHHLSAAGKSVYPMTGNPAGGRTTSTGPVGSWLPANDSVPFEASNYHSQQQQQMHHYSHHHHQQQQQQYEMTFQSVVDGSTITNGHLSQLVSNSAGVKPIPQSLNYGPSQTYSHVNTSMDLLETGVVGDRVAGLPGDATGVHRTPIQQQQPQQYFRQASAPVGRVPSMCEQTPQGYPRARPQPAPQQQHMYTSNTASSAAYSSSSSSSHASMTSQYQMNPDGHMQFMMSASNSSCSSSSSSNSASMTTTGPVACGGGGGGGPAPTGSETEFGSMRIKSDTALPRIDDPRPGASPAYRHSVVGFSGRTASQRLVGLPTPSSWDWPSHMPTTMSMMDMPPCAVGGGAGADSAGLADMAYPAGGFVGHSGTGRVNAGGGELMLQQSVAGQPQASILCGGESLHLQSQQAVAVAQSQVYPAPTPTVAQQH